MQAVERKIGLRAIAETAARYPLTLDEIDTPDFRSDLETDIEPEGSMSDEQLERERSITNQRVEKMSASAYAPFILLRDAIPADLRERINRGHRLCLVARIPQSAWLEPIGEALKAVISTIRLEARLELDCNVAFAEKAYREARLEVGQVVAQLRHTHVVVSLAPDETLNSVIPAMSDLELNLYPTSETIGAAIRRRFPDAGEWPTEIDPIDVHPQAIDLVCGRATSGTHAFEMLKRLAWADRDERERKAEAKANEKPATAKKAVVAVEDILRPTSPRLNDLHGYGQAAVWAADLVRDLEDFGNGRLDWRDVDAGCLLFGPPGTGKTLFASALAASSGLPFIATSFAQWQGSRGGHLGDVVKAMREIFALAEKNAPCILFIDEIDSIPARGGSKEYDDYWRPIVNGMLECLDGTSRREGFVVLAACNDPSRLDPALIRSGRLDRRFEIGLPDEAALARIFAHHLPGGDVTAFETAATVLAGTTSGADVARIAREARRAARRAGREIRADDLLQIAIPPETRSAETVRLVSVHEAGHAIAAMAMGALVEALSTISDNGAGGSVRGEHGDSCGRLGDLESRVVILLAGRAAEEVVLGEPSAGAVQDLQEATKLVSQIVGHLGLGGRLVSDGQASTPEVEARLRDLYGRTLRLIGEHCAAVDALAQIASEKRVLGKKALEAFAASHGFEVRT